jgi:competence protein ComEC
LRLKRPHGLVNPHGFDYEAWLLERGIRATGYVVSKQPVHRLSDLVHRPDYWMERLRGHFRQRIRLALEDRPAAGVVIALAMGDQRAIPAGQWQTFTRTGVNHLMSISGMHVTLLAGLVLALVNRLWRMSERLTLRIPAQQAAIAAGWLTALMYAWLSGFAVPAQRTVYMLSVVAIALWSGRAVPAATVLAFALLAVLLADPWAVLSPGFWLSFSALGIIFFITSGRLGSAKGWQTGLQVQWAVTVALLPLLLVLFRQASIVSPLANAFAIPVVSFLVVPAAIAGMLLPFDLLLLASERVMRFCLRVLEWLSGLPDAVWIQHAPPLWAVALAIAGACWVLLPRGVPARWLGLLLCLPMLVIVPAAPPPGAARVWVLDVGHGFAMTVQTHRHVLQFDTGPAFGFNSDAGERVIAPFLRAIGVTRIHRLIVSHDDADHTGGVQSLLASLPVEEVLASSPVATGSTPASLSPVPCRAGQRWQWDGVQFEMLYPEPGDFARRLKDNDRSCVLKIVTQHGSLLVPTDIERYGETRLLERNKALLRADVLIAPHQGSRTSSSPAFVQAVHPQVVIFPVGYLNRFRHPHADVLRRYTAQGAQLWRTDAQGAVRIDFASRGGKAVFAVSGQRGRNRQYWQEIGIAAPLIASPRLPGQDDQAIDSPVLRKPAANVPKGVPVNCNVLKGLAVFCEAGRAPACPAGRVPVKCAHAKHFFETRFS